MSQRQTQRVTPNRFGFRYTILLIIVLIGFALRLYRLGAQSLWYDETVSAYLATQPIPALIAHTARDIHPPGYYLLLHFWTDIAGNGEFALAYFSVIFGLLLIPLTYILARQFASPNAAVWAAVLTAFAPYHIWYSHEVRMYALGAALGVLATYWAWRALNYDSTSESDRLATYRLWLGYLISAAIGLYTLYYFAFLLIAINLFFLGYAVLQRLKRPALVSWLVASGLVLAAYLPWLPIAWRQATNPPVPPWRTRASFWSVIVESWSALSLGQSVEPQTVWPLLLLTLILFVLGLHRLGRRSVPQAAGLTRLFSTRPLFLAAYTFGPLLLIYFLSFLVPLYHVRYIFTYSPAFYIILGAGLIAIATYIHRWAAVAAIGLLLIGSLYSIYQFHFDPRYRTDDYRAAVDFIQDHWQPGDAILVNAGYVYTAFLYYTDFPTVERQRLVPYQPPADRSQPMLLQTGTINGNSRLGWGNPQSDFYAMSEQETMAALEKLSHDFSRLWVLRAYDTVTDPAALIRSWLAEQAIPIEDQVFAGESNIRAQGFLLPTSSQSSTDPVHFEDGMILSGWQLPERSWQPGQTIPVKLWWMALDSPAADYKLSLKLWTPAGELAAQGQDDWVGGTLYRATSWPLEQTVYHPAQITLPSDLPPGQYWLNVELYHPETIASLPQEDGSTAVPLGPIEVGPRP